MSYAVHGVPYPPAWSQRAESEMSEPTLAPGAFVHVKLHYEGNTPYEFVDDFHHWVVWAGAGKFSDILTGQAKSGAANDASLRAWVKSAFKRSDDAFMHHDTRFSSGQNRKGEALPIANLQPLVSAEHDPRQDPKQKTG